MSPVPPFALPSHSLFMLPHLGHCLAAESAPPLLKPLPGCIWQGEPLACFQAFGLHHHLLDGEESRMGQRVSSRLGTACVLDLRDANGQGADPSSSGGCPWGQGELWALQHRAAGLGEACLSHSLIWGVSLPSRTVACSSMMRKAIVVTP